MSDHEFEVEADVEPAVAAEHLRAAAAGVVLDRPFAVGTAERTETVAPPAGDVELEIEVEREDDEVELEFELEWESEAEQDAAESEAAASDHADDDESDADEPDADESDDAPASGESGVSGDDSEATEARSE